MWTNPERHRSSSTPAPPTYFSAPAPTVREDILNVQADGRLAPHLHETPAPHILEEDAEPNEDLTRNDFTYSHDTTTAFQELLTMIDSNTVAPQKGKDSAPKGGKKGKNKGKDKGGHKGKGKGKGKDQKGWPNQIATI